MNENLQCPKCLNKFNSADLKHERCPDCDRWLEAFDPSNPAAAETPKSKQRSRHKEVELEETRVDEIDESEISLADLVEAQDRTTYAVRSLALYLFITITSSTIGVALIYLVPAAAVPGALLIVVGFIGSIAVGLSELSKSKP
jgi:hypothetical protein